MKRLIYDQFHWRSSDHLEVHVEGTRQQCLEQYKFYKCCFPHDSLGLATEEYYQKLKKGLR
jgi:hypothetical protein